MGEYKGWVAFRDVEVAVAILSNDTKAVVLLKAENIPSNVLLNRFLIAVRVGNALEVSNVGFSETCLRLWLEWMLSTLRLVDNFEIIYLILLSMANQ